MPDPRLTLARRDAVAIVTNDRPDKLNALDISMLETLDGAIAEIERDRTILAAVLVGEGKAL